MIAEAGVVRRWVGDRVQGCGSGDEGEVEMASGFWGRWSLGSSTLSEGE